MRQLIVVLVLMTLIGFALAEPVITRDAIQPVNTSAGTVTIKFNVTGVEPGTQIGEFIPQELEFVNSSLKVGTATNNALPVNIQGTPVKSLSFPISADGIVEYQLRIPPVIKDYILSATYITPTKNNSNGVQSILRVTNAFTGAADNTGAITTNDAQATGQNTNDVGQVYEAYDKFCIGYAAECSTPLTVNDSGNYHVEVQQQFDGYNGANRSYWNSYGIRIPRNRDIRFNVNDDTRIPLSTSDVITKPLRIILRWWEGQPNTINNCDTLAWGFGNRANVGISRIDGTIEQWTNNGGWKPITENPEINRNHDGALDNTSGNASTRDCFIPDITLIGGLRQLSPGLYRVHLTFKPEVLSIPNESPQPLPIRPQVVEMPQERGQSTFIADEFALSLANIPNTRENTYKDPNGWNVEIEQSALFRPNEKAFNQEIADLKEIDDDLATNNRVRRGWINARFWKGSKTDGSQIPGCDEAAWGITDNTTINAVIERKLSNGEFDERNPIQIKLTNDFAKGRNCGIFQIGVQRPSTRRLEANAIYRLRIEFANLGTATNPPVVVTTSTTTQPADQGQVQSYVKPEELRVISNSDLETADAPQQTTNYLGLLGMKMVSDLFNKPRPAETIAVSGARPLKNSQALSRVAFAAWAQHGLSLPTEIVDDSHKLASRAAANGKDGDVNPLNIQGYTRWYYSHGGTFVGNANECTTEQCKQILNLNTDIIVGNDNTEQQNCNIDEILGDDGATAVTGGDCGGLVIYLLKKIGLSNALSSSGSGTRIQKFFNGSQTNNALREFIAEPSNVLPGDIVLFQNFKEDGTTIDNSYHSGIVVSGEGIDSYIIEATAQSRFFSNAREKARSTVLKDRWGGIYKTLLRNELSDNPSFNNNVTAIKRKFLGAVRLKGNYS